MLSRGKSALIGLILGSIVWIFGGGFQDPKFSFLWNVLPLYLLFLFGCYSLMSISFSLMRFNSCPQEALLLEKDLAKAREDLKLHGFVF